MQDEMKTIEEITSNTLPSKVSLKLDLYGKTLMSKKIILNENPNLLNILVIDFGIKNSQLRALLKYNVQLTLVDTNYDFMSDIYNKKY